MRTKQPEATSGSLARGLPPTYVLSFFPIHDTYILNSKQIQKLLCLVGGTPSVAKKDTLSHDGMSVGGSQALPGQL